MNTPKQQFAVLQLARTLPALVGCLMGTRAMAQAPAIIDLGVLSGGAASYANAVSANGSAVAGVSESSGGDRAFRWTPAGGMQDLGVLSGGLFSYGNAISADGLAIAGVSGSAASDRAFRWTANGGLQALDPLPGAATSSGTCLSGDGSTVGGSSGGDVDAVRWISAAGPEVVFLHGSTGGQFPSYNTGSAAAISSNGSVIAVNLYTIPWDGESTFSAWRWTPNGMENVGGSVASAVSADGTAIVGYTVSQWWEPTHNRAFRWTATGGTQDLGLLSANGSSAARAISGDGLVVVGADWYTAFLWTSTLGMVDLNTYLPSLGVDLAGWVLTDARGLSFDGSVIVGNGYLHDQARAWLVSLPRCGSADFNHDGDTATDADIEDFFRCIAGDCCATCGSADFDGNGDSGSDADIQAFFRVLAGGSC
jgi:probable HAF family extracellular repeat protein